MPGEHPSHDHLWNKDKQAYLDFKMVSYDLLNPDAK